MRRAGVFRGLTLLFASGIWLFEPDRLSLQTATINWADVRQTIDGFGGSSADFLSSLTPAQADFFFTPAGIGLSLLRTQIIPDLAPCEAEFLTGRRTHPNAQILRREFTTLKFTLPPRSCRY